MMPETPQLSPLEAIKSQSNYLRGRIAAELADSSDCFSRESVQLLKHHGIYQQDDRDKRQHLGGPVKPAETGRVYSYMVRTAIPGGRLSSDQLLAELDLCDQFGNGTLRITSRQDLQIYGVTKQNLLPAVRRINELGFTTLGSSGDVLRNIMCCPAPYCRDPVHKQIQGMADYLYKQLSPQMPGYREIWLGQTPTEPADGEVEPLYGPGYLPRKFKVAIGLPGDNCVDLYAQDVGLMAICVNYQVVGYNVLVGGGMGVTPAKKGTFPALAQRMAMIRPDQVLDVVRAIMLLFRDFGNRCDRRQARLKYLIAAWGLEKFKAQLEARLGYTLAPPHPDDVWDIDDHIGWHEQGDGRWYFGQPVVSGRITDGGQTRLKSALREICRRYRPRIGLTPGQSIVFCDVPIENRAGIEDLLRRHDVKPGSELSNVRRWAMACVALPTCPQAVTESERALPSVLDQLEAELVNLGLAGEVFSIRMTGCSNGCSRPYCADIGLVGRTAGRYAIHVGGRRLGNRLGFLYAEGVPLERIVAALTPLLTMFGRERKEGETLGDFCHRKGPDELRALATHWQGNGPIFTALL
jgi:sulfite reductase (ferredoxin)